MAERDHGAKLVVWGVSAAVIAASALAMIWMWRGGGVTLSTQAATADAVEECNAQLSGSSAMTARLAQDIAAAFLRRSGYEVVLGEDSVVGARGAVKCTIAIRRSTSSEGVHDLAEGKTLIALTQRPLTRPDIDMLRASGAGDFLENRALAEHVVGFDIYSVVVNAANPVTQVNYDILREVVFRQKTNWRELGGADAPITLYAPQDGSGPEDYPNDLVQNANPAWINAIRNGRILRNEAEVAEAIGSDPNAFAFMSAAFLRDGLRALPIAFGGTPRAPSAENVLNETYPMARRLFAYVRPSDMQSNAFVQRFIAFFQSPEAFPLIEAAGFVALRPESRISAVAANLSGCRFGTAEYAALMSATRGARRLPVQLHFNPQSTALDAQAQTYIAEHAASLREQLRAGDEVILIGHSDYTGDVGDNRALALRRALAVRAALETRGVLGLEVESAGEVCPTADNDSEEGRERNRRVEIWVRARARG